MNYERVLSRDNLLSDHQLPAGCQPPTSRSESPIQDAAVLDFGQVDDTVGLDLDVAGVERGHEDLGGLGGEGRGRKAVEG